MTAGRAHIAPSLRQLHVDDIPQITDIWERSLRSAPPKFDDAFIATERENLVTIYLPRTHTTVACINDVPVGFISLNNSEIAGLFVDPAHQGHGIGRALIAYVRSGPLTVEVLFENTPAVGFYKSLGFKETGHRIHDTAQRAVLQMRLT